MGADQFVTKAKGATAKEAFDAAVAEAQYERGHRGYTGTIAEKDAFTTFTPAALAGATPEAAKAWVEQALYYGDRGGSDEQRAMQEAVMDKWGPAGHVDLGNGEHLFFGWASS